MGEEEQQIQQERVRLSLERDRALIVRAEREREEIATDRARFELTRDKVVFVVGLILFLAVGFLGRGLWDLVLLVGSRWAGG